MNETLKIVAPVVFVLMIIALVLFTGSRTIGTIQDAQYEITSRLQANETFINGSVLAGYDGRAFDGEVLNPNNIENSTVAVWNCTNGTTGGCGVKLALNTDFNATADGVVVIFGAGATAINFNVSYNYTALIETSGFNVSGDGLEGVDSFSNFQGTLAIVAALVIIVALVFGSFMAVTMGRK